MKKGGKTARAVPSRAHPRRTTQSGPTDGALEVEGTSAGETTHDVAALVSQMLDETPSKEDDDAPLPGTDDQVGAFSQSSKMGAGSQKLSMMVVATEMMKGNEKMKHTTKERRVQAGQLRKEYNKLRDEMSSQEVTNKSKSKVQSLSFNFVVGTKELMHEKTSMFLFDEHNRIRQFVIRFLANPWFDNFILIVIFTNTVLMGLADYSAVDEYNNLLPTSPPNIALLNSDLVFVVIFAVEMCMKIFAMGFIGNHGAYLSDVWNWLDAAVVLTGIVTSLPNIDIPSIAAIRTFRVLRPLRSLNLVPGLKSIVNSIIASLPQLAGVFSLVTFIIIVFTITGMQVFGDASMHSRCRVTPYPVTYAYTAKMAENGVSPAPFRCIQGPTFSQISDSPTLKKSTSPWNTPQACYWPTDPSGDQVYCNFGVDDVNGWCKGTPNQWCGSNYDAFGNRRFVSMPNYVTYGNGKYVMNDVDVYQPSLDYGYSVFDSFGVGIVTIFQSVTGEGWTQIMYNTQDAYGYTVGAIYFCLLMLFGDFFVLELLLVVLEESFHNATSVEMAAAAILEEEKKKRLAEAAEAADRSKSFDDSSLAKDQQSASSGEDNKRNDEDNSGGPPAMASSGDESPLSSPRGQQDGSTKDTSLLALSDKSGSFRLPSIVGTPRRVFGSAPKVLESLKAGRILSMNSAEFNSIALLRAQVVFLEPLSFDEFFGAGAWSGIIAFFSDKLKKIIASFAALQKAVDAATEHKDFDPNSLGSTFRRNYSQFRANCLLLVDSSFLTKLSGFVILGNCIVLMCDRYPLAQSEADKYETANASFTIFFVVELALRVFGGGIMPILTDWFSAFDATIVLISVIDISLSPPTSLRLSGTKDVGLGSASSFISILRCFRLFRLIKLAVRVNSVKLLLNRVVATFVDLGYYLILLLIFLVIYAIVGLQFYSNSFRFDASQEAIYSYMTPQWKNAAEIGRYNFDDFNGALASVFQIMTTENWNTILYNIWRSSGPYACIFPISVILIGDFVLMNLFVAILLNNFERLADRALEPNQTATVSPDDEGRRDVDEMSARASAMSSMLPGLQMMGEMGQVLKKKAAKEKKRLELLAQKQKQKLEGIVKLGETFGGNILRKGEEIGEKIRVRARSMSISSNSSSRSRGEPSEHEADESPTEQQRKAQPDEVALPISTRTADEIALPISSHTADEEEPTRQRDGTKRKKQSLSSTASQLNFRLDERLAEKIKFPLVDELTAFIDRKLTAFVKDDSHDSHLTGTKIAIKILFLRMVHLFNHLFPKSDVSDDDDDDDIGSSLNDCYSLGLFSTTSPIRIFCAKTISNPKFENFILALIALSSACLVVDNPLLDPDSTTYKTLRVFEYLCTISFSIEMLLKVITLGLIGNKRSYFRGGWNALDGTICIVSLVSLAGSGSGDLQALKALRAFRALRPLRVISRAPGLRTVVGALISSLPDVFNVVIVLIVVFSIFAVMAVIFLKGDMRTCLLDGDQAKLLSFPQGGNNNGPFASWHNNSAYNTIITYPKPWKAMSMHEKGLFGPTSLAGNFSSASCSSTWPSLPCCNNHAPFMTLEGPTSHDICDCWGGSWVPNAHMTFDDYPSAIVAFFSISTTENWVDLMYAAVDSQGIDMQPIQNNNPGFIYFFIFFVIIGAFFVLNLFIGVIIDNFEKIKIELQGELIFLDIKDIEWVKMQMMLRNVYPKPKVKQPTSRLGMFCYNLQNELWFEQLVLLVIVANTAILASESWGETDTLHDSFTTANTVFTIIFSIEMVIKIIGLQWSYFTTAWNLFDFGVTVGSIIGLLAFSFFGSTSGLIVTVVRVFRVLRVVRMIEGMGSAKRLLVTLILAAPGIMNIACLLFLAVFIYAVLGMQLFAKMGYNAMYNSHTNFRTFSSSLLTLYRFSTGESWDNFMYDASVQKPGCVQDPQYDPNMCGFHNFDGCEPLNGCGNVGIQPFLLTYTLVVSMVLFNLFLSVLIEGFDEAGKAERKLIRKDIVEDFVELWSDYDPNASCMMDIDDLESFLLRLARPLGPGHLSPSSMRAFIHRLSLSLYTCELTSEVKVHFKDVLVNLATFAVMRDECRMIPESLHEHLDFERDATYLTTLLSHYVLHKDRDGRDIYNTRDYYSAKTVQGAFKSFLYNRSLKFSSKADSYAADV